MKSLHVIPTDKSTGIFKSGDNLLFSIMNKVRTTHEGFHIYITSDEEIKAGDWHFKNDKMVTKSHLIDNTCKKIILTTDQDLIKDGVQAIDDDFLEWFVKNPSCEEVEVSMENYYASGALQPNLWQYKIIIPKEEPKIVTVNVESATGEDLGTVSYIPLPNVDYTPKQERMYSEDDLRNAYRWGTTVNHGTKEHFNEWFEQFKKK